MTRHFYISITLSFRFHPFSYDLVPFFYCSLHFTINNCLVPVPPPQQSSFPSFSPSRCPSQLRLHSPSHFSTCISFRNPPFPPASILCVGIHTKPNRSNAPHHAPVCAVILFFFRHGQRSVSASPGHHSPFPNKSNFKGYYLEICTGASRGTRVPLEYEQVTVVCPPVCEPLSGTLYGFSHSISCV